METEISDDYSCALPILLNFDKKWALLETDQAIYFQCELRTIPTSSGLE